MLRLSRDEFSGTKCIVIGCNTGKDCSYFVEFGAEAVHGVDVVDNVGKDFINPRVTYYQISAENMGTLQSNYYDLVYCIATMEHIHNVRAAFSEMVRIAKKDGIIYCVSAPLWNSRCGHHKGNFFSSYPWIHLRLTEEEINKYCADNNILDPSGQTPMKDHIAYMLNPEFFNKLPAKEYVSICSSLRDINVLVNSLDLDDQNVSSDIFSELQPKGYTSEELLAVVHTFVGKKTANS